MNSPEFTGDLVRMHIRCMRRHLVRFPAIRAQILWGCLVGVGVVALTQPTFYSLGVVCLIYAAICVVKRVRAVMLGDQVDRIMRDFQSGSFSGSVLAARLEWLYRFGLAVPSVLPALLSTLP
jgi:hypothetical protein